MKTRNRYARIMLVGIFLVALGVLAIFAVPSGKSPTQQGPAKSAVAAPTLNADAYPLYSGLAWGKASAESETLGTLDIVGFKVEAQGSTSTSDVASSVAPFENYYSAKLGSLGWKEDAAFQADGAGSSSKTYVKGDAYITLSYSSAAVNQIPNQPLSCPCTLTFTVFSGKQTQ